MSISQRDTEQRAWSDVELVEGSGPRLTAVTERLLQRRLKSAAFILGLGFGLFLIRRLFVDSPFWWFHVGVVMILAASLAVLSRRRELSMRQLRMIELLIFGVPIVELAIHQYAHILQFAQQGDSPLALGAVKSTVLYFFALMIVYGMFIPNTWRRATAAVIPMAIVPPLLAVSLRLIHPEIGDHVPVVGSFAQQSDNLLMLVIGAVCAVFGTHVINSLRTEAFEAKQMGRYRLRKKIGSGGMGEVYLAEHQLLKRPCAIKLIRPEKAGDPETLLRFQREVRTTASLSHPNTIEIYDYGTTEEGEFFYVMEFLPGLDLAELVDRDGPLPPERVIYLLRQVCDALAEAHDVGFIHRDIKPGNIFTACRGGRYDVAKLLDFGLVKSTLGTQDTQLTHANSFAGSPMYTSPEQASGQVEPDSRSDIYALGAVAYYLLTGRPPFDGENPLAILISHARDQVLPPSKLRTDIPRDLERVVVRSLAKEPHERYSDVRALAQALSQCQDAGRWTPAQAADWWQTSQWQATDPETPERATMELAIA